MMMMMMMMMPICWMYQYRSVASVIRKGCAITCSRTERKRRRGGREKRYVLTDPVEVSDHGEFGVTDFGQAGIDNFFAHHRCRKW